jgi:hypothetical protein
MTALDRTLSALADPTRRRISSDDETDDARERTYSRRREPFEQLQRWLDEVVS